MFRFGSIGPLRQECSTWSRCFKRMAKPLPNFHGQKEAPDLVALSGQPRRFQTS